MQHQHMQYQHNHNCVVVVVFVGVAVYYDVVVVGGGCIICDADVVRSVDVVTRVGVDAYACVIDIYVDAVM